MAYTERNNVNSGSAAAALGLAVAVDDIENVGNTTNSNNTSSSDTSYDNDVENSHNQDNDSVDVAVEDNDVRDSYNQDNDTITKTINDNDSFTKTVNLSDDDTFTKTITKTVAVSDDDVKDSYNQDNDQDNDTLNVDVSLSDDDVKDSYNQDNDHITKTEIEDSYNQDNDISDSFNSTTTTTDIETTIDVAISDAFKETTDSYNQDNDWLQLDGLDFDVMNVVGAGTLAGEGNDAMFNLSQVSELADQDHLYRPSVSNEAPFNAEQYGDGGYAKVDGDFGDRATASASADGVAQLEAFTQNIVMGSNIQYNNVDMSVVGGDSTTTDGGDIS
jgi:hypothetical protein